MLLGLFGFLFLLISILGFALGGFLIFRGYQSQNWEPTRSKYKVEAHTALLQRPDRPDEKRYAPSIKYLYKVGDEKYRGQRIAFGVFEPVNHFSSEQAIDALKNIIDDEDGFYVYYNPDNPQDSVMIPGIQWRVVGMVMGSAFTLFILGWLFIIPNF